MDAAHFTNKPPLTASLLALTLCYFGRKFLLAYILGWLFYSERSFGNHLRTAHRSSNLCNLSWEAPNLAEPVRQACDGV